LLSRERVECVIDHGRPDRVPIYGWVKANMSEPITRAFGSVEAFEDRYEFDFVHLFGGPGPYEGAGLQAAAAGGPIPPAAALDLPMTDPDCRATYADLLPQIEHHKGARGRWVYVQTPGIFECLNGVFGIEEHLMNLATEPDTMAAIYARQAEWNKRFALNCLDLGIDMIHVSDDWGAQTGLLFSPRTWWRLIHPYHKIVCSEVIAAGGKVSLHSDGNVNAVIDGIVDLGYHVVHPWQESAGMSLADQKARYSDSFVVMGGLDVQTTIGFGRLDFLRSEIERVMRIGADGGLMFCTTHFVQDHCSIEELVMAYDLAFDLARSVCSTA